MTLGEKEETTSFFTDNMNIGTILCKALLRAQEQGRITCGLYESAQLMEVDPSCVMMCLLPHNSFDDVTLHIHYMLLEAFCNENDIRLLKVDSAEKLARLLGGDGKNFNDNDVAAGRRSKDFNCVLVQYPWASSSDDDETLVQFYKQTCDQFPPPIVTLPI